MKEIQDAIDHLSAQEKAALAVWLSSLNKTEISEAEEGALLASLDKAARQLDAGQGMPIEQVRSSKSFIP